MKAELLSLDKDKEEFAKAPSFYHSSSWLKILEMSYGNKLFLLGASENKKLVNLMPCFLIKSRLFGNKIVSLPYCEYGGPLMSDRKSFDMILEKVEELAKKYDVDYVEIRSPYKNLESTMTANGYVKKLNYYTFVLDLRKSLDDLWRSFDKKVRNSVRKAKKNNLKITEELDVKTFYRLYIKTMKRLGSPPHPVRLFRNLVELCGPNMKMVFAEYKNEKIAASIFFLHDKKIYYWKNVSDKEFLHLRPNDFILYEIIEWGHNNGFRALDMGRAAEGAGTYLFKKRWGGKKVELKNFYRLCKAADIADAHSEKYKLLMSLWKKLPNFIINIAGPRIRRNFP